MEFAPWLAKPGACAPALPIWEICHDPSRILALAAAGAFWRQCPDASGATPVGPGLVCQPVGTAQRQLPGPGRAGGGARRGVAGLGHPAPGAPREGAAAGAPPEAPATPAP